ncbi:MAG TPA: AMP-binding protein [Polyangiaceae bacterium]|nr:AMP-binding protein [Polyangiaceae bacterium]
MSSFSILAAAAERPSAVAVIAPEGSFSFADLATRVQRVMAWLQRQPFELPVTRVSTPAACVGVVASSDIWTLTLLYALLELSVPFALIHPRLPAAERNALCQRFPISRVFEPDWQLALSAESPDATANPSAAEAALCIAFTGGTTGFPKACVLSRGALEHAVAASEANLGWQPDDRWQLCLSLAHMGGFSIVLRCLAARLTLILTPPRASQTPSGQGIDLDSVVRDLTEHRATLISLVPTLLQRLLDRPNFVAPPHLRAILIGGDAVSSETLAQARERRFPVFTSYGLTEMASQVATQRFSLGPLRDAGNGPPLPGIHVAIDDHGRIRVRGPNLFSGYWNPPTLELPLTEQGWFCTHDQGSLDADGCLHVLGRDTDLIVSGGENVYPAEVERAIQRYPTISQCCVFGVPDPTWGSLVCALLVGPQSVSPALVQHFVEQLMPHQRPRRVAFVSQLPQTPMGKLDRKAAAQNYLGQLLSLGYH